jgi:SAM-dependent methyltransferase
MRASRPRRSLVHVGGPTTLRGAPAEAERCARAFAVAPGEDAARLDVHGFHVYPARMHPQVARQVVAEFSAPGERVLDPFCGSGTVLVEALALGRRALGVDLNPLAARLAGFKARPWTVTRAGAVAERARVVAERARVARHRAPAGEAEWFEPHVLFELAALRGELVREPKGEAREGLELVLSAILTKLSRKLSDTRHDKVHKQIARGFATRLFVGKAEELARRLTAFAARLPAGGGAAAVWAADARKLPPEIGASTVALCATSPPYAGAFDYLRQHERRARWLGLDLGALSRGELGARRSGAAEFKDDMARALRGLARTLRPGGRAVIVTGDDWVAQLAPAAGLRFVAAAPQPRPEGRKEHLMLLEKP